jgi:hypothetical protein
MAKRKSAGSRRSQNREEQRLQGIYAKSRQEFTAANLQKFTVVEKGVPLKRVIADMERIQGIHKSKKA